LNQSGIETENWMILEDENDPFELNQSGIETKSTTETGKLTG